MEQKLTKAAIIESIHEKLGTNRNDIHMVIDELFEVVSEHSRSASGREGRKHAIQRLVMLYPWIDMESLSSVQERSSRTSSGISRMQPMRTDHIG